MRFLVLLLALIGVTACVGPVYDAQESIASTCPGYHQYNQCEPWARSFKRGMDAKGYPVTLVGYRWTYHGETVNHLVAMWRDTDGWWAQDNIRGPVQVDSFNRYSWATRLDNFIAPMPNGGGEVMPVGNIQIANIQTVQ